MGKFLYKVGLDKERLARAGFELPDTTSGLTYQCFTRGILTDRVNFYIKLGWTKKDWLEWNLNFLIQPRD